MLEYYGWSPLTPRAQWLAGSELARDLARELVRHASSDRSATTFTDAVLLATALGVGASEIQRLSGAARQTVYNIPKQAKPDRPATADALQLQALVLAAGAEGAKPVAEIAQDLRRDDAAVQTAVGALGRQGWCLYEPRTKTVTMTDAGQALLREHYSDLSLRHPEAFSVYLEVLPEEVRKLAYEAGQLINESESVLIDASASARWVKVPELAFSVYAPTTRAARAVAVSIWEELRERAGLPPAAARVVDVAPPRGQAVPESPVLAAFLDALTATVPDTHPLATRALGAYAGAPDEDVLLHRCLTVAARCLRRSLGQEKDPRLITTGDHAFFELEIVRPLRLDKTTEPIRKPLLAALSLACERLGPFPGGRLAQPGGIVESIPPLTEAERADMAKLAGTAVGRALAAGFVTAAEQVEFVLHGTSHEDDD